MLLRLIGSGGAEVGRGHGGPIVKALQASGGGGRWLACGSGYGRGFGFGQIWIAHAGTTKASLNRRS